MQVQDIPLAAFMRAGVFQRFGSELAAQVQVGGCCARS